MQSSKGAALISVKARVWQTGLLSSGSQCSCSRMLKTYFEFEGALFRFMAKQPAFVLMFGINRTIVPVPAADHGFDDLLPS